MREMLLPVDVLPCKKLWYASLLEEFTYEEQRGKEENLQKIISGKENKVRVREKNLKSSAEILG